MRGSKLTVTVAALAGALVVSTSARVARGQDTRTPVGWGVQMSPGEYVIGTEVAQRPGGNGNLSATIRSQGWEPLNVGLLQQSIRADIYRGSRLRLSAYLKTEHAADGTAHLWMRIDGAEATLVSDYMLDRPVRAGRDWALYAIVLDVPANAVGITFGAAQSGAGQLWVDDFALETVKKNVAVTGQLGDVYGFKNMPSEVRRAPLGKSYAFAPKLPLNLDFELMAIAAR